MSENYFLGKSVPKPVYLILKTKSPWLSCRHVDVSADDKHDDVSIHAGNKQCFIFILNIS